MFRIVAITVIAGLAVAGAFPPLPQPAPRADAFDSLKPLLGRWTGISEGQPGTGSVTREYAFALNSRFIRVTNRSEYPPQEKNPKGEVHEDEGFISFDRTRKRLVFRQFHVERFVIHYVEDIDATSKQRIVFTSEAIENIPAGFQARETYILHGPDDLEELFEMSEPGKPFTVYSRTRLKRMK